MLQFDSTNRSTVFKQLEKSTNIVSILEERLQYVHEIKTEKFISMVKVGTHTKVCTKCHNGRAVRLALTAMRTDIETYIFLNFRS